MQVANNTTPVHTAKHNTQSVFDRTVFCSFLFLSPTKSQRVLLSSHSYKSLTLSVSICLLLLLVFDSVSLGVRLYGTLNRLSKHLLVCMRVFVRSQQKFQTIFLAVCSSSLFMHTITVIVSPLSTNSNLHVGTHMHTMKCFAKRIEELFSFKKKLQYWQRFCFGSVSECV